MGKRIEDMSTKELLVECATLLQKMLYHMEYLNCEHKDIDILEKPGRGKFVICKQCRSIIYQQLEKDKEDSNG